MKKNDAEEQQVAVNVVKGVKLSQTMLQTVRGMRDILPSEQPYWERARSEIIRGSVEHGFERIDLPVVEYTSLFTRSIGDGTDVMDKEIYSFVTRGDDKVSLRPEATAGKARAYIENGMAVLPKPVKLFTIGPMYRYDRPQEGRYREFYQADFDVYGENDPIVDAQMIALAVRITQRIGVKKVHVLLNSIGLPETRKAYRKALISFIGGDVKSLCSDCVRRIKKNPLRILDCKNNTCRMIAAKAPSIYDFLDEESAKDFALLKEYLNEIDISYTVDHKLVRGLDYYTKTVFELTVGEDGLSLGGGGRYDLLIEQLGGQPTPVVGFSLGIDRLVMEMKKAHAAVYTAPKPRVFIAQLGDLAKKKSLRLFTNLCKAGVLSTESFGRGNLRSQLRSAEKKQVDVTLIIGQQEALDGTVIVKNMLTGSQETVPTESVVPLIRKIIKDNDEVNKNTKSSSKKYEEE